jgi:Malectin domain/IPT/TIG domain
MDSFQQNWYTEQYLIDPWNTTSIQSVPRTTSIRHSFDDVIYQSIRTGPSFGYQIPISQIGEYDIIFHFVELFYNITGQRIFDIHIGNETIVSNIDIVQRCDIFTKCTIEIQTILDHGTVHIQFTSPSNNPNRTSIVTNGLPMISGIEIKRTGSHLAHAVINGPYTSIDRNNVGRTNVIVDATNSHTHGTNRIITNITWYEGNKVLGRNKLKTNFSMTAGIHEITLMIQDSGGSISYDQTTITVHPYYYPSITSIVPSTGRLSGMEEILIVGSGFINETAMTIQFGDVMLLLNTSITYINSTMLKVITPSSLIAKDVPIQMTNPMGTSTEVILFSYMVPTIPIVFQQFLNVIRIAKVASCLYGPDKFLYIGTTDGKLGRYQIDYLNIQRPMVRTSYLQQVISTERAM